MYLYLGTGTSYEALPKASYILRPSICIWELLVRPYEKRPTSYVHVFVFGNFL